MKRVLIAIGLGVGGAAFALALTVGTLAVAGPDVGEPPVVPVLDQAPPSTSPSPSSARDSTGRNGDDDRSGGKDHDRPSPTASPSADDRGPSGGGTGDDSGSEDHGSDSGTEDHGSDSGTEDHDEPDDD